ncbi:MAG: hypothetical protein KGY49_13495 [Wenzhouxiangellaceae bacterium]|nr:hypothetical protein [Wenzhouxiangellaceae bacterium]
MRPRTVRLLILLFVTLLVAAAWYSRDPAPPDWDRPLKVVIYPENADGSAAARAHIEALSSDRFAAVETWLAGQAARYRLDLQKPFELELADTVSGAPGEPDYASFWAHLQWGLRLRLWYWTFDDQGRNPDITFIVRYREGERRDGLHSLGIPGMDLALANLTANESAAGLNNVVLAHELLHTVGADDLYDPATGLPEYPQGYADPDRRPRHPQSKAELMAGRIPLAPDRAVQADRLEQTVIGARTAADIGWTGPPPPSSSVIPGSTGNPVHQPR